MDQRFPFSQTLSCQERDSSKTLCNGSVDAVGHSENELPTQIKTATARKLSCGPARNKSLGLIASTARAAANSELNATPRRPTHMAMQPSTLKTAARTTGG